MKVRGTKNNLSSSDIDWNSPTLTDLDRKKPVYTMASGIPTYDNIKQLYFFRHSRVLPVPFYSSLPKTKALPLYACLSVILFFSMGMGADGRFIATEPTSKQWVVVATSVSCARAGGREGRLLIMDQWLSSWMCARWCVKFALQLLICRDVTWSKRETSQPHFCNFKALLRSQTLLIPSILPSQWDN